jgi:hypothetical protein
MKLQKSRWPALIKVICVPALFALGALAVMACVSVISGDCPDPYGNKCTLLCGNTDKAYWHEGQGGTNTAWTLASGVKIAQCTYSCAGSEWDVGYEFQAVGTCP